MSTDAMTEIERINVLLPTELFAGSKDWRVGSIADRVDWLLTMYSSAKEEVERLQSALEAQPQQEPVAWMQLDEVHLSLWEDGYHTIPLYTSPPAQEFVCSTGLCHYRKPLTDEKISDLWCKVSNTDFVTADTHVFAQAIEAKLKEKNT